MTLRRVRFVPVSLTGILRRSGRYCSTSSSTPTTTTSTSAATTLWSVDSAATREKKSLASVEDMFGQVESEESNTMNSAEAAARLTSSTHAVDEALFDWEDETSSVAEGLRDLCLESVMNAALGELHTADEIAGVSEISKGISHSGNRTSNLIANGDSDSDSVDDDKEDDSEEADDGGGTIMGRTDDVGMNDESTTTRAAAAAAGMGSKLDAVNVEYDNDEEDASSLLIEEEEEQVEELLRAAQTSETASALFFKDQKHKKTSAKTTTTATAKTSAAAVASAFDDAAAEGAELESVGEVMPSPQRV
ncbi:uncharacterized protein TM35_000051580 [Trypanosoma theileri]|uniref:Uncharacterized protein n=1 Tax=Trypanosoma theileri TaxID=67003 RepID=A0A1X0P3R3_9TRYP|nr:uncharacterized protein TM35_000051580 [Trypanosoma theileri]ORC91562.1 hypothetical protein TM35_000051580 [Trypanosoma theileri]